jgi:non-ribosomal peptide synthetase component F
LRRVRESAVGAYEHQELPFERLVESMRVERDPAYNPLFQVNFRAGAGPREILSLPGIAASAVTIDIGFSRFDLALELELDGRAIGGYFEYDEELFHRSTIEGLASDLESLLAAIAADPDTPLLALIPAASGPRRRPGRTISRTAH